MVNGDVARLLLSVLTVFMGGGAVQLLIFLLRRRAELRQLSTTSEVNQATAAETLIRRLQEDGATYREQVAGLHTKLERLEDRHVQAQRDFAAQLRDAHIENTRLVTRVAQLQTDLDIAGRQLDELRWRLGRP